MRKLKTANNQNPGPSIGVNISDYVASAKEEMKEEMKKINNAMSKVNNNLNKNKTVKVKYYCDYLPEDKKDPLRKKMIEKLTPKYAHDGDIGMDLIATSMEYDVENDRYISHRILL